MAVDVCQRRAELQELINQFTIEEVANAAGLTVSSVKVYRRGGPGSRTIPTRALNRAKRKLIKP